MRSFWFGVALHIHTVEGRAEHDDDSSCYYIPPFHERGASRSAKQILTIAEESRNLLTCALSLALPQRQATRRVVVDAFTCFRLHVVDGTLLEERVLTLCILDPNTRAAH